MSSPASAAEQHFLQFAIQWASIALLYYDYVLTFPSEFKFIWRSKLKVSTGLYILYRYALLANILYLLAISNKLGHKVCDIWYKAIGIVSVFGRAAVIFTFLMRTYAVYNRSNVILVGLGAIGLTCFILDCVSRFLYKSTNTLLSILMCVFEATVTLLTFFRSMQALRFGGGPIALRKHTLDYLIVEQGVFYFGLVTVITIAAVVLNFKAAGGFPQRLLNALILPLSGLLTARFLLGIRAYGQYTANPLGRDTTQELSSFAVTPRAPGGRQGSSFADEFGEDPLNMVFRAAESLAASGQSASDEGSDGRREAVFAELLGQMRRGLTGAQMDEEGTASVSRRGSVEEKFATIGDMNDLEAGDQHASSSKSDVGAGAGAVQGKQDAIVEGSVAA